MLIASSERVFLQLPVTIRGYLKRLTRESLLSKPQCKAARSRTINKTTIIIAPIIVRVSLLSVHFTRSPYT